MKRRIIATVLLALVLVGLLSTFVSAKNVCSQISGTGSNSKTFTVKTTDRWLFKNKLVIKQTKGTVWVDKWFGKDQSYNTYGIYDVKVVKVSTGKTQWYKMKGASVTLKLDDYSTYRVTVTPADTSELQISLRWLLRGYIDRWTKQSTWRVNKTAGIELCS